MGSFVYYYDPATLKFKYTYLWVVLLFLNCTSPNDRKKTSSLLNTSQDIFTKATNSPAAMHRNWLGLPNTQYLGDFLEISRFAESKTFMKQHLSQICKDSLLCQGVGNCISENICSKEGVIILIHVILRTKIANPQ